MIKRLKQIFNIQNECIFEPVSKSQKQEILNGVKGLNAFTLAEVLVVIGIIGVVSALTIPNLQQGTNSQEVVTKVTKARATIDEAFGRAIATYGPYCTWSLRETSSASQAAVWYNHIFENMKTTKKCGLVAATNKECWDGASLGETNYKVKLADGTSMAMSANTGMIASGYNCDSYGISFSMYFDIDGPDKGMGSACDDVYMFSYLGTSLVNAASGNLTNSVAACTKWVLENKNADFLKATYKESAYNCKNGTILNWSTNKSCN